MTPHEIASAAFASDVRLLFGAFIAGLVIRGAGIALIIWVVRAIL